MMIAIVVAAGTAEAGIGTPPAPTQSTSETDTRAFVGLNWTFGQGRSSAEGVLGVARVKSDSDGDARGAKLSLHLPIEGGLTFGAVKLTGMTGQTDAMGEAGVGFGRDGVFGTAGLWLPYVNFGLDLGLDGGLRGYAGFQTLEEWDRPREQAGPTPF